MWRQCRVAKGYTDLRDYDRPSEAHYLLESLRFFVFERKKD